MSDRKIFVAFQNLNKLQTLSLYHECFFLILCLKIIQHGTINSAFMYIYTHTLFWRMMVWVMCWAVLIFGSYISYWLFVTTFSFLHFKFLPSLSQCTSWYSTSENLKLIPLENENILNFHFDSYTGPIALQSLFQYRICYPFKLFFLLFNVIRRLFS